MLWIESAIFFKGRSFLLVEESYALSSEFALQLFEPFLQQWYCLWCRVRRKGAEIRKGVFGDFGCEHQRCCVCTLRCWCCGCERELIRACVGGRG